MATRKVTITLENDLVDAIGVAAREAASAAEREMRRHIGRQVLAEWQAEHGAFTPEELAAARAEIAAADNEYFRDAAGAA